MFQISNRIEKNIQNVVHRHHFVEQGLEISHSHAFDGTSQRPIYLGSMSRALMICGQKNKATQRRKGRSNITVTVPHPCFPQYRIPPSDQLPTGVHVQKYTAVPPPQSLTLVFMAKTLVEPLWMQEFKKSSY